MDEFELDAGLHDRLRIIRESVRQLFEQLRLREEDGDVTGTARLERVPALAKRNFGQLADPNAQLAIKEAWRLIDFLEGRHAAGLSPLAREALRGVELDRQLAALRASDPWVEAALRLREAIGASTRSEAAGPFVIVVPAPPPNAAGSGTLPGGRAPANHDDVDEDSPPASLRSRLRRNTRKLVSAALILVAVGIPTAIWHFQKRFDPGSSCVAIDSASATTLAEHWKVWPTPIVPRPPARGAAVSQTIRISDPPNWPVSSIWTTSRYSYARPGLWSGPGGGLADVHLRVGGWGDTYVSLLQVPVPTVHPVRKAVIELTVLSDDSGGKPTSMVLREVREPWDVEPGANHRLWWRDCPYSSAIRIHLPPPGPPDSVYQIDITDLYNLWERGLHQRYGIMLEPEHVGRWAPGRPRYANFSAFYSTRAPDPETRPRLVLTY